MFSKFIAASVCSLGVSAVAMGLPAAARPEIASGDQWLEGISQDACLERVDNFVDELNVPVDAGEIDRTGYFDDGVFRILCYSGGPDASMVIVFTAHNSKPEVATQFMQFALEAITQPESAGGSR